MVSCSNCGVRWVQGKSGLCRTCEKQSGNTSNTFDRERERLKRSRARRPATAPEPDQKEPRIVTIDGQEYEIKWDGSR